MTMPAWMRATFWALLAAPGVWQIGLLVWAIAARFPYPYDLEWMEGGVLHGAQRVADGDGLYPPPSVDFIPFLYTPLYPGLLAALGSITDVSYQLGRAISIASLLGLGAVAIAQGRAALAGRAAAGVVGALALGALAAGALAQPAPPVACHIERERYWNGARWRWRDVEVCP